MEVRNPVFQTLFLLCLFLVSLPVVAKGYYCNEDIQKICVDKNLYKKRLNESLSKLDKNIDILYKANNKVFGHLERTKKNDLSQKLKEIRRKIFSDSLLDDREQRKTFKRYKKLFGINSDADYFIDRKLRLTAKVTASGKRKFKKLMPGENVQRMMNRGLIQTDPKIVKTMANATIDTIVASSFNERLMNKVYSHGEVYTVQGISSPFVDIVGNIYLPLELAKSCSSKCIETILSHELIHIAIRGKTLGFDNYITRMEEEFGDVEGKELLAFKKYMKKLSLIDYESLIDMKVLEYYKDEPLYLDAYVKVVSDYLLDENTLGDIRIKKITLIGDYLKSYDSKSFFDYDEGYRILNGVAMIMESQGQDAADLRRVGEQRLYNRLSKSEKNMLTQYKDLFDSEVSANESIQFREILKNR